MARLELTDETGSLALARAFASATLGSLGLPEWPTVLVVSELASNVIRHAATPFTVSIDLEGRMLRVAVSDGAGVEGIRRDRASGRRGLGLTLVDRLTADWGVDEIPDFGKVVWARIDLDEEQPGAS